MARPAGIAPAPNGMRAAIRVAPLAVILALMATEASAQDLVADGPWWKRQKIIFMWGQWDHAYQNAKGEDKRRKERDMFRNVALAGATVFAAHGPQYRPDHARYAHEFGLKYFTNLNVAHLPQKIPGAEGICPDIPGARKAITQTGELFSPKTPWCPLDEFIYNMWIVEPHIEGIRAGLIDGIHFDWEYYYGRGEPGICYCDHCFAGFLERKGIKEALPEKAERFPWLKRHNLTGAYEDNFHKRRVEMFRRLAGKLRAVNPDLLFSCYAMIISDFTRGVHTPRNPLILLDSIHYYNDDRQPWWESNAERLKREGYLYIAGGWTNALFGAQASQVSAARWIYETSINDDGCWVWFERELDDEILRAYAAADRRIKAVQAKVAKFLFLGKRDRHFVTAVEWTGRPQLDRAVIARSYHLGDQHLTHVNNVNTEWPIRTRIRFPRLAAPKRWTLRDAMGDLCYTRDGKSPIWTTDQLNAGVVVAIEPRSDLFLLISPAEAKLKVDASRLVRSREFGVLPIHAAAASRAGPPVAVKANPTDAHAVATAARLVFTAAEPMGFEGAGGKLTMGNAIRRVDGNGGGQVRLRQLRGHLWSPTYSPDGGRIAFVHDSGGLGQVFVMNHDGSGAVNLSNNGFCDRSPVWSPDGTRLVFLSDRTGDWDVYAMNADGSGQRRLAGNPGLDRAPAWSPDGKRLAWESHVSGMPNIWVCDPDGRNTRPLVAPDKLLIQVPYEPGHVLTPFPDNTHYLRDPAWSPDGKRIAAGGIYNVVVLDADGSRMLEVLPWMMGLGKLVWSPDGKQLAGTMRTGLAETERAGVFLVEPAKPRCRWLVTATPTGPRLGGAKRVGLNTSYSHGSARPTRLVKTFTSLTWSADGKTLAFSSDMDPSGAFYVYTVSPEGGLPRRLDWAMSAWPNQIAWR